MGNNKEYQRAYTKVHYLKHREVYLARAKKRRKEKAKEIKAWKLANAEQISAYKKEYERTHNEQRRKWRREWSVAQPEKIKEYRLKMKYGLTRKDLKARSEAQDNCCAICGRLTELVVDHNHRTNEVRGLLCRHCNIGLGHFKDNSEVLIKAANYLNCTGHQEQFEFVV